jgi:hypothetical protein
MLAYIFLFDLRLLDVLVLYYYYSQTLGKMQILYFVYFYIWLVRLTSQLELVNEMRPAALPGRQDNEPIRVKLPR